jgi:hypothetical protein
MFQVVVLICPLTSIESSSVGSLCERSSCACSPLHSFTCLEGGSINIKLVTQGSITVRLSTIARLHYFKGYHA